MHPAITAANAVKLVQLSGQVIDYEMVLTEGYRRLLKPGDVAVDVGAHSGQHLEHLVRLVGEEGIVHAFEPVPHLAKELQSRFQSAQGVRVHPVAVSRTSGEMDFIVAESLAESGLRARFFSKNGMRTKTIRVKVESLDTSLADIDRITFIKMDVEGGELDALAGSTALLARHRPFVSVEYGWAGYSVYGHERRSLFDFAVANDYVCADLFGNLVEDVTIWETVVDFVTWDFFLVPRERKVEWVDAFSLR